MATAIVDVRTSSSFTRKAAALARRLLVFDCSHGILWRDIMKVAGELEQTPWKPLGDRVVRQPPTLPEWQPLPHAPSIEVNKQGQLRTNLPLPK
jgi:hypothetical protein